VRPGYFLGNRLAAPRLLIGREQVRQVPSQAGFVVGLAPEVLHVFSTGAAQFYEFSLPSLNLSHRYRLPTHEGHRWAYFYDHLTARHYFVGEQTGQKQLYEFSGGQLIWVASLTAQPEQVVDGHLYFRRPTDKKGHYAHHLVSIKDLTKNSGAEQTPVLLDGH
jgi:hypothetical protein